MIFEGISRTTDDICNKMLYFRFTNCVKLCLLINLVAFLITILVVLKEIIAETIRVSDKTGQIAVRASQNVKFSGDPNIKWNIENGEEIRRFILKNEANSQNEDVNENNLSELKTSGQQFKRFDEERAEDDLSFNNRIDEDDLSEHIQKNDGGAFNSVVFKQSPRNLQQKIVHLDLKGAPPRLSFLRNLLPLLKSAGATGLLIEYEDMFPYGGILEGIKAKNAYDKKELLEFLEATKSFDIHVIPLVQTFGHLEFLLKLEDYRELREMDEHPDSICPTNNRSFEIIKEMLSQVMDLHSQVLDLKWFHIGCDEVYHINQCDRCLKRNLASREIFVAHVVKIADLFKRKYPKITPLIWDDMLRSFTPSDLAKSGLGDKVQPVVWIYSDSITNLVPHRVWYQYTTMFQKIWIASAYKGASGAMQILPDIKKHYENHLAWLHFVSNYKISGSSVTYNFQGIFLTGWSRYEHFAVLCEILPVSLPSLILNLLLVNMHLAENKKNDSKLKRSQSHLDLEVYNHWIKLLKCPNRREFQINLPRTGNYNYLRTTEEYLSWCDFYGNHLYDDIKNLIIIENSAINFHVQFKYKTNGFLEYNVNHDSLRSFHTSEAVEKAIRLETDINMISKYLQRHLFTFVDNATIEEFIEYKVSPMKKIVQRVVDIADRANNIKIWQRRPFQQVKGLA